MKALLQKEFKLAMHPTAPMFLCLSAMALIPNYPYYVSFFYLTLAVFFICLSGRENQDVFYTLLLPIRKRDVVKARMIFVICLEIVQVLVTVPFAILRQHLPLAQNVVGIEANIAFFGFAFLLLGIYNLVFFSMYYKDVKKVGKAFAVTSIVAFIYIMVAESLVHIIPFFRDCIDTYDTQYVPAKVIVLICGIIGYLVLTGVAYVISAKNFEKQDL